MTKASGICQALMEFYFKDRAPFQWLIKLYEFFALDNTPSPRMVSVASCCMEGEAWECIQDAEAFGFEYPTRSVLSTNP